MSDFEKELVKLGIIQILAGVRHPQTNGKLERFHGEIQRKLPRFESIVQRASDPIDLFMKWYNMETTVVSLDWDNSETLGQASAKKMPKPGTAVIDEQTGEKHHVE